MKIEMHCDEEKFYLLFYIMFSYKITGSHLGRHSIFYRLFCGVIVLWSVLFYSGNESFHCESKLHVLQPTGHDRVF